MYDTTEPEIDLIPETPIFAVRMTFDNERRASGDTKVFETYFVLAFVVFPFELDPVDLF